MNRALRIATPLKALGIDPILDPGAGEPLRAALDNATADYRTNSAAMDYSALSWTGCSNLKIRFLIR
jgi:hypothetical protein